MDKNTVLIFSDTVLKRYEEPLNTIFLYNVENDTIWAGNSESFAVLALVDGKNSVEQISFELQKNYHETDFETVYKWVFYICTSLYIKGIVKLKR